MNITKIASAAALTLATSVGLSVTSAVVPATAQAASTCRLDYGNTRVIATFTFYQRNVSVDWNLTAASGSGRKRVELSARNEVEDSYDNYGAWVNGGSSGRGTVKAKHDSAQPGGYGTAYFYLKDDQDRYLGNLYADRSTCYEFS